MAYPTSADDTGIYESTDSCVQTNSCYAVAGGTSFAAPHVAGALALLIQHFDGQLGNTEILNRLFETANKEGRYADSSIYGQGLMDLDTATMPVGQTSIATINSLTNSIFPTSSTSLGFKFIFIFNSYYVHGSRPSRIYDYRTHYNSDNVS